jgi:hypothetical protein
LSDDRPAALGLGACQKNEDQGLADHLKGSSRRSGTSAAPKRWSDD